MPAGTSRLALLMRNRKRKGMKAFRMKMKLQHEAASKVQSLIRAKLGRRAYLKTLEKIVIAQSKLRSLHPSLAIISIERFHFFLGYAIDRPDARTQDRHDARTQVRVMVITRIPTDQDT